METICLFAGPDRSVNVALLKELRQLPGVEVRATADTKVLEGVVILPFIELEDGARHFGVDSIHRFVATRDTKA